MNESLWSGLRGWVVRYCPALAVALILSACGGGGGDDAPPAPVPVAPVPPVAASIQEITPEHPLVGEYLNFKAAATGGKGQLTYRWYYGDGDEGSDAVASHRYREPGTYSVTLAVFDKDDRRATATTHVVVDQVTAAIASADVMRPDLNQEVSFQAKGQGPEPLSYAWNFADGSTSTDKDPKHAFGAKGTYGVELIITDGHGHNNRSTLQVSVLTDAPTLAFTTELPKVITAGVTTWMNVGPINEGDNLRWDFGDGRTSTIGPSAGYTFAREGTYLVTVVKTDRARQTATASVTVTVKNPSGPSGATIYSTQLVLGESALLRVVGSASDSLGKGWKLAWDFGDGTKADGASAEHRYPTPGSYVVTLVVTDTYGQSTKATATIGVGAAQTLNLLAGKDLPSQGVDGVGAEARFNSPTGLAFNAAGDLYIADKYNNAVRRMKPDGTVSTVAGDPTNNSCAGGNTPPTVSGSMAVAVTPDGNLQVLTSCYDKLVQIAPDGSRTRRNTRDAFGLDVDADRGLAADSGGNLYFVVSGSAIRKLSPNGENSIFAGNTKLCEDIDGIGQAAQLCFGRNTSTSLAIDGSDNLYAMTENAIRKITPNGTVTTLAGAWRSSGYIDGPAEAARFGHLSSIAVDPSGNVYVVDTTNMVVRKISTAGTVSTVSMAIGTQPTAGFYDSSFTLTANASGTVFMSDASKNIIRRLNPDTSWTTVAGLAPGPASVPPLVDGTGAAAVFSRPTGVVQGRSGNFYVADARHLAIRKITPSGVVTTLARLPQQYTRITVGWPPFNEVPLLGALAVDDDENVYLADTVNHVILKITPDGSLRLVAGKESEPGGTDGRGPAARFFSPMGIAIDAARNLYVTDTFNHTIRKIDTQGQVTTIAGTWGNAGSANGVASKASFSYPSSIAVDAEGRLFVADTGNNVLRKILPDGTVSTIMGRAGERFVDKAKGIYTRTIFGLALDPSNGNLFFADESSNQINVLMPDGSVHVVAGNGEGRITTGDLPGRLREPQGIAVTADHQLVITSADAVLITTGF